MAEKYKLVQRANASEHYSFTWRVFVGWDFAITDPKTANAKQKQISVTLKETIGEAKKKEDPGLKLVDLWFSSNRNPAAHSPSHS